MVSLFAWSAWARVAAAAALSGLLWVAVAWAISLTQA
jgi:hypothetical protein